MKRRLAIVASTVGSAAMKTVTECMPQVAPEYGLRECEYRSIDDIVAVIDTANAMDSLVVVEVPAQLKNPFNSKLTQDRGFAAELLLTYPECYFIFVGPDLEDWFRRAISGSEETEKIEPNVDPSLHIIDTAISGSEETEKIELNVDPSLHIIDTNMETVPDALMQRVDRHRRGFRTMFDPAGLRNALKYRMHQSGYGRSGANVRVHREYANCRVAHCALSIDEEISFLYLNAYSAYRAGFRCWLGPTMGETAKVLDSMQPTQQSDEPGRVERSAVDVVISDFQLQFPDLVEWGLKNELGHPKTLALDAALKTAHRFIKSRQPKGVYVITACPVSASEEFNRDGDIVLPKPYGGIFEIIQKKTKRGEEGPLASQYGRLTTVKSKSDSGHATVTRFTNHSAPFWASRVSANLIARARAILAKTDCAVEEFVWAAVLSLEAKELLAGLARTQYFEACACQSEAEVAAEAAFYGMGAQLSMSARLEDLDGTLRLAGNGLGADATSERAITDATMQIANSLRIRLQDREQFEGAQACLGEVLRCEQKLDANWITRLWKWYLRTATKSGSSTARVAVSSGMWIVVFAIGLGVLEPCVGRGEWSDASHWMHALWDSASTFIELQPGCPELVESIPAVASSGTVAAAWSIRGLVLAEVTWAYVHLGLLISVLYRKLLRSSS